MAPANRVGLTPEALSARPPVRFQIWFARHDQVQVAASMSLYYQEGDNTKRVTLDLFVARGLESLPPSQKLWEAGRPPSFVLEVASPSTEDRDRGGKQALYASIGVKEFWRFHPSGSLKGARRAGTRLDGERCRDWDTSH